MKIFIFVIFAVSCAIAFNEPDCIDSYLKRTLSKSNVEATNCNTFINNFTVNFTNDVMARLKAEDDQICILKAVKNYKIIDFFLKGLAEDLRSNFTAEETYGEIIQTYKANYIEACKFLCLSDAKWESLFNYEFSHDKQNAKTENSNVKLCKQKYFIEKKFINPADYGIDVALINATDCNSVVKEIEREHQVNNEFQNDIDSVFIKSDKCIRHKIADEKIFLKFDSFKVVAHFELTSNQKNTLRMKYSDNKKAMARLLLECAKNEV